MEDTLSHLKHYAGTGIRTAWVTGYLRTLAPSRPHPVPAAPATVDAAVPGAVADAATRTALAAEDRQHVGHGAQERSVTMMAAEAQTPPPGADGAQYGSAPQQLPDHAPRVRARVVHRPGYVDIKVQSMHQLLRRIRRTGS